MAVFDATWVAKICHGLLRGKIPEKAFIGITTDSRNVREGELFIALVGRYFDGHDYVAKAVLAGAKGAIVRCGFTLPILSKVCLIEVSDPLIALGELACNWRKKNNAIVVGITGSTGKTTTKEMLANILRQRQQDFLVTKNNFNNLIGVPLTLMQLESKHFFCVLEMGTNMPGEIARLTKIVQPNIGVITNVGLAHIGMLGGSIEAVALAKGELYEGLSSSAVAIVNIDNPLLRPYIKTLPCQVIAFSLENKIDSVVYAYDIFALGLSQTFSLKLPGYEPIKVHLKVPGRHNIENALAAASVALVLGISPNDILAGLESFKQIPGRLSILANLGYPTVLDDSYNANPNSLIAGLEALAIIAAGRRRILILGDMVELGEKAVMLHRYSGFKAARSGVALILVLGQYAREVAQGAQDGGLSITQVLVFTNIDELIAVTRKLIKEFDVVLVKGSRIMAMERVANYLSKQWKVV